MEVVEILIFIGFAVILGGLVLGFISGWNYKQTYDDMKVVFRGEERIGFKKVDRVGFANELYSFFEECKSTGFNMSLILYVQGNQSLTKEGLFDIYKSLDWCTSIQSASNDCGVREDIIMDDIELPRVVRINCSNSTLSIK